MKGRSEHRCSVLASSVWVPPNSYWRLLPAVTRHGTQSKQQHTWIGLSWAWPGLGKINTMGSITHIFPRPLRLCRVSLVGLIESRTFWHSALCYTPCPLAFRATINQCVVANHTLQAQMRLLRPLRSIPAVSYMRYIKVVLKKYLSCHWHSEVT